jgi:NAD+ synthase
MEVSNEQVCSAITRFIRKEVIKRDARVVVVGISGGIDSAVTVSLATKALGREKVFGLILPDSSVTPKRDTTHAIELARRLNIRHKMIELKTIKKNLLQKLPDNKLARGNLLVRLRMSLIYYYAAILNGLVLGTGDKSEMSLGYFTKYGDGAADLLPIADLYKTEVRSLARYLSIPNEIISKESSARLWKGHTAEGEIGIPYEDIDLILDHIGRGIPVTSYKLRKKAARVKGLIEKNKHKNEMPLVCKLFS